MVQDAFINIPPPESRTVPVKQRNAGSAVRPGAYLLGLGTARPELVAKQVEIEHELAGHWQLRGEELHRWGRICRGAGIEQRHGVQPLAESITLSTAERMERFESSAPPLAEQAARRALAHAGVKTDRVTELIVVSCTGFAAPGLDVALIQRLRLSDTVRRTMIGFMGCFGAINGLRSAVGACAADPSSIALVVCCELCSLHVQDDPRPDGQVACALFGDGAAAAVVAGDSSVDSRQLSVTSPAHELTTDDCQLTTPPLGRLTLGHSRLIPASEEMMSWRITDAGFAMTLAREVPVMLHKSIATFVEEASERMPRAIVPHPGGPGILNAIEAALPEKFSPGIEHARSVLRRCGNMSSGTVLFVLERLMRSSPAESLPAMLLAFGPGLTMESIELRLPND